LQRRNLAIKAGSSSHHYTNATITKHIGFRIHTHRPLKKSHQQRAKNNMIPTTSLLLALASLITTSFSAPTPTISYNQASLTQYNNNNCSGEPFINTGLIPGIENSPWCQTFLGKSFQLNGQEMGCNGISPSPQKVPNEEDC
jgi:hypothetical protein